MPRWGVWCVCVCGVVGCVGWGGVRVWMSGWGWEGGIQAMALEPSQLTRQRLLVCHHSVDERQGARRCALGLCLLCRQRRLHG